MIKRILILSLFFVILLYDGSCSWNGWSLSLAAAKSHPVPHRKEAQICIQLQDQTTWSCNYGTPYD